MHLKLYDSLHKKITYVTFTKYKEQLRKEDINKIEMWKVNKIKIMEKFFFLFMMDIESNIVQKLFDS